MGLLLLICLGVVLFCVLGLVGFVFVLGFCLFFEKELKCWVTMEEEKIWEDLGEGRKIIKYIKFKSGIK